MGFNSLTNKDKTELRGIIDQMTEVSVDSFEKVEMAIAQGCPRAQFMSIVNMKTANEKISLKPPLKNLKSMVEAKLGDGAFDEEEILSLVDSIVRNNHENIHFRKLVDSFDVSDFVINKVVEIRTRSPLDSGSELFAELFQIEGVDPTVEELAGEDTSGVEEERALNESKSTYFNPETRKMVIDIALGVGLGVSAIALLV